MKMFLFGSNGMLGRYIKLYLQDKYDLSCLTRDDLDLSNSTEEDISSFLFENINKNDIIINASGLIKHRNAKPIEMIKVNSIFPQILANFKKTVGCEVIHITTDCVFNGNKGSYSEFDAHDCYDIYGRTKSLGESVFNTNIRTSIIGEEITNKLSLLEWVLSMEGGQVQGFQNHTWNGVTCLELAVLIHKIIEENTFWSGTRHIFSPNIVSKFSLIQDIVYVYKLKIDVRKTEAKNKCFRNLCSNSKPLIHKDIHQQLIEMKNFTLKETRKYDS